MPPDALDRHFIQFEDGMDARFLDHLVLRYVSSSQDVVRAEPTAIPDTADIVSRNNLGKASGFYVTNFDKPRVKK